MSHCRESHTDPASALAHLQRAHKDVLHRLSIGELQPLTLGYCTSCLQPTLLDLDNNTAPHDCKCPLRHCPEPFPLTMTNADIATHMNDAHPGQAHRHCDLPHIGLHKCNTCLATLPSHGAAHACHRTRFRHHKDIIRYRDTNRTVVELGNVARDSKGTAHRFYCFYISVWDFIQHLPTAAPSKAPSSAPRGTYPWQSTAPSATTTTLPCRKR